MDGSHVRDPCPLSDKDLFGTRADGLGSKVTVGLTWAPEVEMSRRPKLAECKRWSKRRDAPKAFKHERYDIMAEPVYDEGLREKQSLKG